MADFAHMKIHRSQDRPSGWTVAKSKISFHTLVLSLSCHCPYYGPYCGLGPLMFGVRWSKLFQLLPCFGFRFRTCVKWFEDNGESYRGTLLHLACGAEDLMLDGNAARHKISILLGVAVSEASRYPLKGPGFIWELTFLLTKSAPIVSGVQGSPTPHPSIA